MRINTNRAGQLIARHMLTGSNATASPSWNNPKLRLGRPDPNIISVSLSSGLRALAAILRA
jgi:hypothetical protein